MSRCRLLSYTGYRVDMVRIFEKSLSINISKNFLPLASLGEVGFSIPCEFVGGILE
jgi:hypothetical protein